MTVFKDFKNSFYNFEYYRELSKRKIESVFFHVLILSLLVALITGFTAVWHIDSAVAKFQNEYLLQIPEFTIENGTLKVEKEMPYVVFEDDDRFILITDTRDNPNFDILSKFDSGVAIFKDKMINKKSSVQSETLSFSELKGAVFTRADLVKFIEAVLSYKVLFYVLLCFVILIGVLIGIYFSALIYSVAGLIISPIFKVSLPFGSMYAVSIYALTFPVVLNSLATAAGYSLPFVRTLIMLVYLCLILNILKNNTDNDKPASDDSSEV